MKKNWTLYAVLGLGAFMAYKFMKQTTLTSVGPLPASDPSKMMAARREFDFRWRQ